MIIVGYTGSSDSTRAVEYAAKLSWRIGTGLRIVHAFDMPTIDVPMGPEVIPPSKDEASDWYREVTDEATEVARRAGAQQVETVVEVGPAHAALITNATEDDLIVVGSRGRGEFASAFMGSVSYQVSAHAPCPVVVVTCHADLDRNGPVVVGVDGSEPSQHAADLASDWANHEGIDLVLVAAWQTQTLIGMAGGWAMPVMQDATDQIEQGTVVMVDEVKSRLAERHPDLTVTATTVPGDPAAALVEASRDASLLVVGSRGRGGFAGLLLGSISHRVLHDATVPVAVVR
ncbi:universal stress protein [Propionibacteriaceae bacterium Y2011]|uniref:universal stress protein n=1 Tax=Microlunatus sp. Y2014 TaxID=3418488 RepID=UPI003B459E3F